MGCNCGNTCDCGHGSHQCSCGCCGHSGFERRFATKEERLQDLESYLESLQNEVQAVTERIEDLKK